MEHGSETLVVAGRLEALGNETRLSIYHLLVSAGDDGITVGAIQRNLEVPASTLSHHLQRLMNVGLAHQERNGRQLICRADFNAMDNLVNFLTRTCCSTSDRPRLVTGDAQS